MTPPVLLALWWVLGPSGVAVQIEQQRWRLVIEIETLVAESASGWCDEMPAGAREIGRRLLPDPSGQRSVPTDHCRYSVPTWRAQRSVQAEGDAPGPGPWPRPDLNGQPPEPLGAERAGKRHAFYELLLRAADGRAWTCRLAQPQWQAYRPGQRLRLQVDRFGTADCGRLPLT
jgi:hypothetical protein